MGKWDKLGFICVITCTHYRIYYRIYYSWFISLSALKDPIWWFALRKKRLKRISLIPPCINWSFWWSAELLCRFFLSLSLSFFFCFFCLVRLQVEPLCMGRPPSRSIRCAPRTRAGTSVGSWCWSNSPTPSTTAAGCTSQSTVSHPPTAPAGFVQFFFVSQSVLSRRKKNRTTILMTRSLKKNVR